MSKTRIIDADTYMDGNRLVCMHCQESYTLTLPISVDNLAKKARAFNDLHKHCILTQPAKS